MEQEKSVGPINLGNPSEFTIRQLAEKVLEKTSSSSRLVEETLPEDDPTQRRPDISLVNSLTDWTPQIELDEGLDKTIAYFKKTLSL
jgi:UDP-glucuronate decarboxylase